MPGNHFLRVWLQVFVNRHGRIIDLASCLVQRSSVMVIVSPSRRKVLRDRLEQYIFFGDKVVLQLTCTCIVSWHQRSGALELITGHPQTEPRWTALLNSQWCEGQPAAAEEDVMQRYIWYIYYLNNKMLNIFTHFQVLTD